MTIERTKYMTQGEKISWRRKRKSEKMEKMIHRTKSNQSWIRMCGIIHRYSRAKETSKICREISKKCEIKN
jgi:hypothetical protein